MRLIVESTVDGVMTIVLEGGLDAQTAPRLSDVVNRKIDAGVCRFVLDGRRLTFLGSQGVGALLALHHRCRRAGGDLKLAGLRGMAAEVIRTSGLHLRFDLHDHADAARHAFAAQV